MKTAALALSASFLARLAVAQCTPTLDTGFAYSALDGDIAASAMFDVGSGPALYVGGNFTSYNGSPLNYIARWDGTTYQPVGGGFNSAVNALLVWDDDGPGPHPAALYAAGSFTSANNGATPVSRIARWDGVAWSAVPGTFNNSVHALCTHNDGAGEKLIAGGRFTTIDGLTRSRLAAFDGAAWHDVANGVGSTAASCVVYVVASRQEAEGPTLYVGGDFTHANDTPAKAIARLRNGQWSALGTGLAMVTIPSSFPFVQTLAFADLPTTGPALIVGGGFERASGLAVAGIAKWNGTAWSRMQYTGNDHSWGNVRMVGVADMGTGPALYASNYNGLERWNGTTWDLIAPGVFRAYTMTLDTSAPTPRMYLGGQFTHAGDVGAPGLVSYDGSTFTGLGSFGDGINRPVVAMTRGDIGQGERLYAIGNFTHAGGIAAQGAAMWNGTSWTPVGDGFLAADDLRAITVFDDGTGPTLFVAAVQDAIYKLVNGSWQLLPELNFWTNALVGYDPDDAGPQPRSLYAVGQFVHPVSGVRCPLARWTGSAWDVITVPGLGTFPHAVAALPFDPDGAGPQPTALYLAGTFPFNSATTLIARWDGTTLTPQAPEFMPSGPFDLGFALAVHDSGAGPTLHVMGSFAGTTLVRMTDEQQWEPVTGPARPYFGSTNAINPTIRAMHSVDLGRGPELVLLGTFNQNANPMALRDGAWQPYTFGIYDIFINSGSTLTGMVHDDGSGPAFFIGGDFTGGIAPGNTYPPTSNIARINLCRSGCTADFNGDGDVGTDQDIEAFFACIGGTCCDTCAPADFNNDGDTATDQDIESFFRVLGGGHC